MSDHAIVPEEGVNQITVKGLGLPVSVGDAMNQYEQIDLAIKRLQDYKAKMKKWMAGNIEVEANEEGTKEVGVVDGVKRLRYVSQRTAYQKVLTRVVDELVPRTKLGDVKTITEEFTSASWSERFSRVEEGGEDEW